MLSVESFDVSEKKIGSEEEKLRRKEMETMTWTDFVHVWAFKFVFVSVHCLGVLELKTNCAALAPRMFHFRFFHWQL